MAINNAYDLNNAVIQIAALSSINTSNVNSSFASSALNYLNSSASNMTQANSITANQLQSALLSSIKSSIDNNSSIVSKSLDSLKSQITASNLASQLAATNASNTLRDSIMKQGQQTEKILEKIVGSQSSDIDKSIKSLSNEAKIDRQLIAKSFKESVDTFTSKIEKIAKDDKLSRDELLSKVKPLAKDFFQEIEDYLRKLWDDAVEFWGGGIQNVGEYIIDRVDGIEDVFVKLNDNGYKDLEAFTADLFGSEISSDIAGSIWKLVTFVPLLKDIMSYANADTYARLNELALSSSVPKLIDESLAIRMFRLNLLDADKYLQLLRKQGFSKDTALDLLQATRNLFTVSELQELYRREEIGEEYFKDMLFAMGYQGEDIDNAIKLSYYQPTPNDVIRFVVRDVYDPVLSELGKIFEGWDNPTYLKEAAKAGIKPEHAKAFWGSHWQLPSPTQAYEMLHRGLINNQELDALLKAADYAPAWRPKLAAISYNNPTRVDTRRMFEMGVIDANEVLTILKAQGYNDRYANFLLDFFKRLKDKQNTKTKETKTLSVNTIVDAYRDGILDHTNATNRLVSSGYTPIDADIILRASINKQEKETKDDYAKEISNRYKNLAEQGYRDRTLSLEQARDLMRKGGISDSNANKLLELANLEYNLDRNSEIISTLRQAYIGYEIDESELIAIMSKKGFTSAAITKHLEDIKPLRELRFKDLAIGDIKKAYNTGVIDLEEVYRQLLSQGYSDRDMAILYSLYFSEGLEENT